MIDMAEDTETMETMAKTIDELQKTVEELVVMVKKEPEPKEKEPDEKKPEPKEPETPAAKLTIERKNSSASAVDEAYGM